LGREPVVCVKFAPSHHYKRESFEAGLEVCGYKIAKQPECRPKPGDVLVLWNRYVRDEHQARLYENCGATVLVAENSWLGPEEKAEHHFALCIGHHNGAGQWHIGAEPRSPKIPVQPWRSDGEHILVLPQRGMGEPGVRQERSWTRYALHRLSIATKRPVVVKDHPGPRPHPPIDFEGAWACVTWASGAAIKAIVAGVPCFYEFPKWIGAPAARFGIDAMEKPFLGDRGPMLHRLSWAQWTAEEIAKGEPFKWLLK
jgi:hypothetical protein